MSSTQVLIRGNRSETSMPLFAVLAERAFRAEQFCVILNELVPGLAELLWSRLAVELVEQRFYDRMFLTGLVLQP